MRTERAWCGTCERWYEYHEGGDFAEHVAAEVDKALGGLTRRYRALGMNRSRSTIAEAAADRLAASTICTRTRCTATGNPAVK